MLLVHRIVKTITEGYNGVQKKVSCHNSFRRIWMEYSAMHQYLKLIHDSKPDRKYSWTSIETTGDRVIIDVSIYFSGYDKQLVTIQLDGEISHAAIGGKLQHLFLECISSDRIKVIIECTKLRYLAHTAGGWPFVTLAKLVKQNEGIAILVNCTEEYLT